LPISYVDIGAFSAKVPKDYKLVLDDDLTNLEDWLRQLKVEYGIYFNGNRKKPPDDLRMRVEKLLKRLSEVSGMSCSQRFRFNTLITRYYVHRDLWRRTMKERELSKENEALNLPEPVISQDRPSEEITILIADPATESAKVRLLYDALTQLNRRSGKIVPAISYEQFAKFIGSQTQSIRGKFQCHTVVFTLALDENAIRFTAKAGSEDAAGL
jgi:hypothetical protein